MRKSLIIVITILFLSFLGFSKGIETYIVQSDIGDYKYRPKPTKEIYGNSGIVISADHFDEDHDDISYVTRYIKPEPILGVDIQVTRHAGGDSDKWLLHEIEMSFRDPDKMEARPDEDAMIRTINNNSVLFYGGGIIAYRWIRNSVVVNIQYSNLSGPKTEPLEVVRAYLSKYPSTITATDAEFKSKSYNVKWIKDEMERRLWLCDKWLMQLQLGKATQTDTMEALVKNMTVFLNYRQKYYGVTAGEEIAALNTDLRANDGTTIKNKLTAYKFWWRENKAKRISL